MEAYRNYEFITPHSIQTLRSGVLIEGAGKDRASLLFWCYGDFDIPGNEELLVVPYILYYVRFSNHWSLQPHNTKYNKIHSTITRIIRFVSDRENRDEYDFCVTDYKYPFSQ